MLVALVALSVAVGGTGLALSRIDGSEISNRSIPAKKMKRNSITGAEVKESRLGPVPSAANGARRIDFTGTGGDPAPPTPSTPAAHRLLKVGAFTLRTGCTTTGPASARVYVTGGSPVHLARMSWDTVRFDNPGFAAQVNSIEFVEGTIEHWAIVDLDDNTGFLTSEVVYRDPKRTVTLSLYVETSAGTCRVQGTAVDAPAPR